MHFIILGFNTSAQNYNVVHRIQEQLHKKRVNNIINNSCLLLEHTPVYTSGKLINNNHILNKAIKIVQTDRGGKITWHGYGQIICYPIIKLKGINIIKYIYILEQIIIDTCLEFNVQTFRIEKQRGVWTLNKNKQISKIAFIGVKMSQGVTMHGFSFNYNCTFNQFQDIISCGIEDINLISLKDILKQDIPLHLLLSIIQKYIMKHFRDIDNSYINTYIPYRNNNIDSWPILS